MFRDESMPVLPMSVRKKKPPRSRSCGRGGWKSRLRSNYGNWNRMRRSFRIGRGTSVSGDVDSNETTKRMNW
jgi:hypothetical protein